MPVLSGGEGSHPCMDLKCVVGHRSSRSVSRNQNPPHPLLTERVIHESTARRPYEPALLDGSSCDIHCRCSRCYGSTESHANSHVHVQSHTKLRDGGACWSRRRRWW